MFGSASSPIVVTMTITEIPTLDNPPADAGPITTALVRRTGRRVCAGPRKHAAGHDRDGTWVHDSFEHIRQAGLLAVAVPTELGGDGATISEVAADPARTGQELRLHRPRIGDAPTRHRIHRVALPPEPARRRGNAASHRRGRHRCRLDRRRRLHPPSGVAVKVEGGYRISGRKSFVSQAPVGAVLSTMFAYDDPSRGLRVLNMSVPFASDGVRVVERWDTLGMRGTSSHDVDFEDVFVPDERVLADRPHGEIDPPLQVISSIGFVVISAVYLGIAEGAYAHAVASVAGKPVSTIVQRQVGLMTHRLRVAAWALEGALAAVGDDPAPSMDTVVAVMLAKREIALAADEVCDLAMAIGGRTAFDRGSPIERAYRDVRAAKFHPLDPELTLVHAGRVALGLPADRPQDWGV